MKVKLLIVGCGARGTGYGRFALDFPDKAQVVAIAEPNPERRNAIGDAHGVPENLRFEWEQGKVTFIIQDLDGFDPENMVSTITVKVSVTK